MKSHEVLKEALGELGIKRVAADMNLSESMVYKWCQPAPSQEELDRSGAQNPLDRVMQLYKLTKNPEIIAWLCEQANGTFVENPKLLKPDVEIEVIQQTRTMIKEFSELLNEVTRAIEDGSGIDDKEAARIRREWEQLKRRTESFVAGCEQGLYGKPPKR